MWQFSVGSYSYKLLLSVPILPCGDQVEKLAGPTGRQPKAEFWLVCVLLFGKWPLVALSSWHSRLHQLDTHLGSVFCSGLESDFSSIPIIAIRPPYSSPVWSWCLEIKLFILNISLKHLFALFQRVIFLPSSTILGKKLSVQVHGMIKGKVFYFLNSLSEAGVISRALCFGRFGNKMSLNKNLKPLFGKPCCGPL